MKRSAAAPARPAPPWSAKAHLGLTAALALALAAVGGLALAGRVQFGQPPAGKPKGKAQAADTPADAGRYRVEPFKEAQDLLANLGRKGFFGDAPPLDAWVFRYRGGLPECRIEGEIEGGSPITIPDEKAWKDFLADQEAALPGSTTSAARTGHIVLTAQVTPVTPAELAETYQGALGAFLGLAPHGPLHALTPLALEVKTRRDYRFDLSLTPASGGGLASSFTRPFSVTVRSPLVPRDPAQEPFALREDKPFEPGKRELLLDRTRGFSRLRLFVRFPTDDELRSRRGDDKTRGE